jgi:hypothetical protein
MGMLLTVFDVTRRGAKERDGKQAMAIEISFNTSLTDKGPHFSAIDVHRNGTEINVERACTSLSHRAAQMFPESRENVNRG